MSSRQRTGLVIGLTGSPGTGKKTAALALEPRLGVPCYSISGLAEEAHAVSKRGDESTVDTDRLKARLAGRLWSRCLVYGHLLSDVIERRVLDVAIVLRCEPSVLKVRLSERKYDALKVRDNVEAELIGYASWEAKRAYGPSTVWELDTTRSTPAETARALESIVGGRAKRGTAIDWVPFYDSAPKLRALLTAESNGRA